MDGLIILNKPSGITSAKALYRVRKACRQRKSGHAGTLDPAASGVLILCMGKATKLTERLMDHPKAYRAIGRLDLTSPSFDLDGEVREVPVAEPPTKARVAEACSRFQGEILQVPPRISALKVGGIPAYKLAQEGRAVPLAARPVQIYDFSLRRYAFPEVEFDMRCGRGTYVRAIIRDLGEALGTGGVLTSLVRTRIGPFRIEDACTFEMLESPGGPEAALIPLDAARAILASPKPQSEPPTTATGA